MSKLIVVLFISLLQVQAAYELEKRVFTVSEGTESFFIQIESQDRGDVFVSELTDPNGKKWITPGHSHIFQRVPEKLYPLIASPHRHYQTEEKMQSIMFPNDDSAQKPTPGAWTLYLKKEKVDGSHKALVTVVENKNLFTNTLHFKVLQDESFIHESILQEALDQTRMNYLVHNISIAFNSNNKDKVSSLYNLLSSENRAPSLHLSSRQMDQRKYMQGLSHCLPGFVPKQKNKSCSIDVITSLEKKITVQRLANVITHEIAHFLGLYHYSDDYFPYGKLYDPISDTFIEDSMGNFMFKRNNDSTHLRFTPGQVDVMKRHPLLNADLEQLFSSQASR